jgi:hypothetical protein
LCANPNSFLTLHFQTPFPKPIPPFIATFFLPSSPFQSPGYFPFRSIHKNLATHWGNSDQRHNSCGFISQQKRLKWNIISWFQWWTSFWSISGLSFQFFVVFDDGRNWIEGR